VSGRGHVERGGPPRVERLSPTVTLTKVSVGPMDNNAYLLAGSASSLLIDAANDADRLLGLIGQAPVDTIITTHRHGDHLQALDDVARATGARLVAGRPDAAAIAADAGVGGVDEVWDGDSVPLGEESLQVIGLVGHTPGSIALVYRPADGLAHLFSGDSLFPGGVGRTRSPEDFRSLLSEVESKIFLAFEDDTVVHPGHGDDTTLGNERPHLEEWRQRGW
jgi:glyoxylase-like metal-dependent hydrolase (beta-lactamase superfamily II)